jgi:hypothetical protein
MRFTNQMVLDFRDRDAMLAVFFEIGGIPVKAIVEPPLVSAFDLATCGDGGRQGGTVGQGGAG